MGLGAVALGASPAARALASPLGGLGLSLQPDVNWRLIPSRRKILEQVQEMVALGPRLTGNAAHQTWIDQLEREMSSAGVSVSRDHFRFTRWEAESWQLEILEGAGAGRVPVASYFPYSGATSPTGLEAKLSYLGPLPLPSVSGNPLDVFTNSWALERWRAELADDLQAQAASVPGGIQGRIALLECPVPPLAAGDFTPFVTYTDTNIQAYNDYKRVWVCGAFIQYVLEIIKGAGAAGAVFIMDASKQNAAGQYTPYAQPIFGIPALYVDRDTGTKLRKLAAGNPKTRLTLVSRTFANAPSDSLVGVMPGDGSTDEVIILNTHTDGQNAFEENGGIALRAMARYFAALGRRARKRTLVFSLFTGHFGPGLPQAQGFVENHPDLIKRAAASVTVEHFGSTEWLDDGRGYYPTGNPEVGALWHSQTPIAVPAVESIRADGFVYTSALRPIGDYMVAVGGPFHKAGVPSLSYIAGPNYLVSLAHDDHIGKLDPGFFRTELGWLVDILRRLDKLPKAALGAGDTTVWGQDGGALNPIP
jgi:hypothetical protein